MAELEAALLPRADDQRQRGGRSFLCRALGCGVVLVAGLCAAWRYGQGSTWPPCGHAASTKTSARALLLAQHENLQDTIASFGIDLKTVKQGSELLWGSFFEEINHAGEGGLYSELVQDRSFDALVNSLRGLQDTPDSFDRLPSSSRVSEDPMPWAVLHGAGETRVSLSQMAPTVSLRGPGGERRRAVQVSASAPGGGLANAGFWGIPLQAGRAYNLSLWAAAWAPGIDPNMQRDSGCPSAEPNAWAIDVRLLTAVEPGDDEPTVLAGASFSLTCAWTKLSVILRPDADAEAAVLTVAARQKSDFLLDHVSLIPLWNADELATLPAGAASALASTVQPWPFRPDLFSELRALRPRFLRFPGGCFVEGDRLAHAVHWKNTVGLLEARPGHWNLWGYWSSDGLGLYEYLLLAEALGAEPVWVANSGMSHSEQVPPSHLLPWIQETLDGLEFIVGAPDSRWGALRASMGHPAPFELKYIAVGNEDAGMPHYVETYLMFWAAIKSRYPALRLIANDEIRPWGELPNDLWDYHVYTDPERLFNLSTTFDAWDRAHARIFVSEFAVTVNAGRGNLRAAIAEAAFMTGLERNADLIELASYAPLFVRTLDRRWNPDMIVFNGTCAFGTPSYWGARLFSQSYHPFLPHVAASVADGVKVRASAVCTTADCSAVNVRIVSMQPAPASVRIIFSSKGGFPEAYLKEHTVLTGRPDDENSLQDPQHVSPAPGTEGEVVCVQGRFCDVQIGTFSAHFLTFSVAN